MPTIYIDGEAFEVEAGNNLLQTCLTLGKDLPYFCWHPALGSVGACRQCAVIQYQDENDTRGRIVMSCMTPVTEGARFSVDAENAKDFRERVIESLMLNHPHDCPVCAEGGECHLQDMTVMVGHRQRRYRGKKNTFRNQYLGPLIHHEMNRCITCYRCVRYYKDYAGGTDLSAQASRDHVYFGRHQEGILESEFAGNLVEVCPTGVFTDKTLVEDYTRKWDLQTAPSVCVGCAVGCNTTPGERYGRLKRIHNRFNSEVNGYFLCDRGRFGGGFVNSAERIPFPGLKQTDGSYKAITEEESLQKFAEMCATSKKVAGIGSPRASVEANYLLQSLVGAENYSPGFSDLEHTLIGSMVDLLASTPAKVPSLKQIEQADAILILGEDVTNTAPRQALSLRQSVGNKATELAYEIRLEGWQDGAKRNLAQDERSPLYIAAVSDTRLDDVAAATMTLSPAEIARLGFAIAHALDSEQLSVNDLSDSSAQQVAHISEVLRTAKKPLIVSGTGCQSQDVIAAAGSIAAALVAAQGKDDAMLSLCAPECNSVGQALLAGRQAIDLQNLVERIERNEIDALIVLENDLARRASPYQLDVLLNKVPQLIVLDSLDNETASQAQLVLPAASFAESEGTLVSSEGRAQRYYPVFKPADGIEASWRWLVGFGQRLENQMFVELQHFDQITTSCADSVPALQGIDRAAPDGKFRTKGMKIPRQTHRYSGRTAMRADVSVHEPKQPVDEETPLAYSMEGLNGPQPSALIPYVWSPGWNSNQSVQKFQAEAGGALKEGPAGVRLFDGLASKSTISELTMPGPYKMQQGQFLLVPLYQIFGSDELSLQAPAIAELSKPAGVVLNPEDAGALGVKEGDGVRVIFGEQSLNLEVSVRPGLLKGAAGFSAGRKETTALVAGTEVVLEKASDWQRRTPELIGSDKEVSNG